jgi:hypothetical protein
MSDQVQGAHDEFNIADIGGPAGKLIFWWSYRDDAQPGARVPSKRRRPMLCRETGHDCERRKQRL